MMMRGLNTRGGMLTHGLNPWAGALERLFEILAVFELAVVVKAAREAGVYVDVAEDAPTRLITAPDLTSALRAVVDAHVITRLARDLDVEKETP